MNNWLEEGYDVYAYFNDDFGGEAVHDARTLARQITRREPQDEIEDRRMRC